MSKADKDGWIRHRGGKQPLPDNVLTQVILRKESKKQFDDKPFIASDWEWSHCNCGDDVMYYREHKPAEQVEPLIEAVHAFSALAKVPQLDGPISWRDRITEIDATTSALATERADIVQKLASEGFALIGRVGDMSDSKKWMVGDLFTVVGGDDHDFEVGDKVVLIENDGTRRLLFAKGGVESWVDTDRVGFHSRQSA